MAGTDGRDPRNDYKQLLKELELYDKSILDKPRYVIANKMDKAESAENLKAFKKKHKVPVMELSAEKNQGLVELENFLHEKLVKGKKASAV